MFIFHQAEAASVIKAPNRKEISSQFNNRTASDESEDKHVLSQTQRSSEDNSSSTPTPTSVEDSWTLPQSVVAVADSNNKVGLPAGLQIKGSGVVETLKGPEPERARPNTSSEGDKAEVKLFDIPQLDINRHEMTNLPFFVEDRIEACESETPNLVHLSTTRASVESKKVNEAQQSQRIDEESADSPVAAASGRLQKTDKRKKEESAICGVEERPEGHGIGSVSSPILDFRGSEDRSELTDVYAQEKEGNLGNEQELELVEGEGCLSVNEEHPKVARGKRSRVGKAWCPEEPPKIHMSPSKELPKCGMTDLQPAKLIDQKPATVIDQEPAKVIDQEPATVIDQEPAKLIDQKPAKVIDQKPAIVIDQKPAKVINQKPAIVIDQKPAKVIDQKPATVIDQKPTTVTDQKPAKVIDQKPAKVIDQKPANVIDQKPAKVIDQKPATVIDQKPAKVIDQNPATVIDQEPAKVIDQKPAKVTDQEPATVIDQETAKVIDQKPAKVTDQEPATVIDQEPAKVIYQKPATVIDQEPATVINQKPATVIDQEPAKVIDQKPATVINENPATVINQEPVPDRNPTEGFIIPKIEVIDPEMKECTLLELNKQEIKSAGLKKHNERQVQASMTQRRGMADSLLWQRQDSYKPTSAENVKGVEQAAEKTDSSEGELQVRNSERLSQIGDVPVINVSCIDHKKDEAYYLDTHSSDQPQSMETPTVPVFVVPPISVTSHESECTLKLSAPNDSLEAEALVTTPWAIKQKAGNPATVKPDTTQTRKQNLEETAGKISKDSTFSLARDASVPNVGNNGSPLSKTAEEGVLPENDWKKLQKEAKIENFVSVQDFQRNHPSVDRLASKPPTHPSLSPSSLRKFMSRTVPESDIEVSGGHHNDKPEDDLSGGSTPTLPLSCESSPRMKRRDSLTLIRSATPEELASGARRKIFMPRPKEEGEGIQDKKDSPYMSPSQARRAALLQCPTGQSTPPMERRSPLVSRRKATLEVPKFMEEPSTEEPDSTKKEEKQTEKKPDPLKGEKSVVQNDCHEWCKINLVF